ncbi:MAG: LysE family transporter [Dehalococcoidia bacterium]|nr:LysE family transporter [Dehalococcoidia bacterium]
MDGLAALAVIFGTSLLVGLSGALMPGPLLTIAISESARKGFRVGPLLVLGHGMIEALVVLGLTVGLSEVLRNGAVSGFIGLLGGSFLLWMGFGLTKAAWRGEVSLETGDTASGQRGGLVVAGILISISNPYWILWWATVGATYVLWALERGAAGLVSFYTGHILSDLGWYSAVAIVVSRGKSLLSDRVYRGLLLLCGVFLLCLGVYFVDFGRQALGR